MAYKLEYADEVRPEDLTFESHGVTVLVDPKSLPYLDGTELDFAREGLNEGFKFNNPNVKDACGCGESVQRLTRHRPAGRGRPSRPPPDAARPGVRRSPRAGAR